MTPFQVSDFGLFTCGVRVFGVTGQDFVGSGFGGKADRVQGEVRRLVVELEGQTRHHQLEIGLGLGASEAWGSGFRIQGVGFRVQVLQLGFNDEGFGFQEL